MKHETADNFFDDINFVSIVDTVKGIFTSDGSMAILLDYERVLDESDLYAYKNWQIGELVQGPTKNKYTVKCIFMWPYKLMPDPSGAKRLMTIGCKLKFAKSKITVPVEVHNYEDFIPGTRYPKSTKKEVWFVQIEIPNELMNEIREGTIDLAGQEIDLDELDDSYDADLEKSQTQDDEPVAGGAMPAGPMPAPAKAPAPAPAR